MFSKAHLWLVVAAALAVVAAAWVMQQSWAQTVISPVANAIGATWAQALVVWIVLVIVMIVMSKVGVHAA
jgi:hypothetical protein